uniref:ATP synthase subunit e, mitochondrial n=1 Tax=Apteryx owenii TaxID=8824 RepID=A0A8B9PPP2_APTOW
LSLNRQVSPFIFLGFITYLSLWLGKRYRKKTCNYLKSVAEEERRVEDKEGKMCEEREQTVKEIAKASGESILK